MIYLNSSATSIKRPDTVAKAMVEALSIGAEAGRGGKPSGQSAASFALREKLARFFGAKDAARVIFTSGATMAINTVLFGYLHAGDTVVYGEDAHNAVIRPVFELTERHGVNSICYELLDDGRVNFESFKVALAKHPKLVVINGASNVSGLINPIKELTALSHASGAKVMLDASQLAGSYPINMQDLGVDGLAAPGHKGLLGPNGIGVLLLDTDFDIEPLIFGGTGVMSELKTMPPSYPEKLEAGTHNAPGIAGLSAAIDYLLEQDIQAVHQYILELIRYFAGGLRKLQEDPALIDFDILGYLPDDLEDLDARDPEHDHASAISLVTKSEDITPEVLVDALAENYDILCRAGLHCAPLVHKRMGTAKTGALRFSFSRYTQKSELDAALLALRELLER